MGIAPTTAVVAEMEGIIAAIEAIETTKIDAAVVTHIDCPNQQQ